MRRSAFLVLALATPAIAAPTLTPERAVIVGRVGERGLDLVIHNQSPATIDVLRWRR